MIRAGSVYYQVPGTNYYRKVLKISFKAKILTSQGEEFDEPLTFGTRNKRAGARVRYITRGYYRSYSHHSNVSMIFGGWITRARP